jgi:hypothetical protein
VTFQINFEGKDDQAMARIFLLEINDCKKDVMNAPVV